MKKEQLDFTQPYGLLLGEKNIKLHRQYFDQMVKLLGVQCIHKAPRKESKHYSDRGEIKSNSYENPVLTGCIFQEHPDVKTMKKMGWVTELSEQSSVIHVPYDLQGLQQGSLFVIPDALNPKRGRVFRVKEMRVGLIYPASIACEIVPEWKNNFEQSQLMFKDKDMTLLDEKSEWKVELVDEADN